MVVGLLALVLVLLIRIWPIFISLYLVIGKKVYSIAKRLQVVTVVIGLNLIVFEAVHCLLRGYVNFGATIYYVYILDFTYEELLYFPISFLICYIAAIIIGKMVGAICGNKTKGELNGWFIMHTAAALLVLVLCQISVSGQDYIVINEVCSNNQSCYMGARYEDVYCDYVEICNTGMFNYEISGLWLSDDKDNLKKFPVPESEITAGECVVVGLDDGSALSIASEGEWVFLSDSEGRILDEIYSVLQEEDVSYSRIDSEWELRRCSPGVSNTHAARLIEVKSPELSHDSGFYDEAFYIELFSEEETDIYYTLDGSIPNENSQLYRDKIYVYDRSPEENKWNAVQNVVPEWKEHSVDDTPVDKAFIIRAIAMDAEGNKSDMVTATYFVGKNYDGQNVISLVADPDSLFGENGICVTGKEYDEWYLAGGEGEAPVMNFWRTGRESEVGATMELFREEGVLTQEVGMRVMGGSTRNSNKKRFTLTARKEYGGTKWFDAQLFGDYDTHTFSIREGFANAFAPELVKDRDVATLKNAPVVVYLNGEYWYTSYITERYTEEMFATNFGVEEDNVLIIQEGIVKDSDTQEDALEKEIYAYLETHDMSQDDAYKEFCDIVDIQSYIDYCCINLYLCNVDCNEKKNCIMWRTKEIGTQEYEDARWRWTIYDMDAMQWGYNEYYDVDSSAKKNNFAINGPFIPTSITRSRMFLALKENDDFCEQFILSFLDIANTNFSVENVSEALKKWGKDISWNGSFFAERKEYALQYLAEELEIEGSLEQLNMSGDGLSGGDIVVNTSTLAFEDDKWSGEYFTNYSITVSAQPKDGYRFVGWTGDLESKEATIEFEVKEGGSNIHAVFEKND